MRKQFLIPLLLLGVTVSAVADFTSHTFFSIRPPFQSAFPEKTTLFRNMRAKAKEDGWMGAMQAVVFGGRSTKGKKLAKFFLPGGTHASGAVNELIFAEQDGATGINGGGGTPPAVNPFFRDVNATNFNIQTADNNFASRVSFNPRQTYVGGGFDWIQYFGWNCDPCDKRWWFEISFPVLNVKNDMRLTETILTQGAALSSAVNFNVEQAFSGNTGTGKPFAKGVTGIVTGSGFNFGKIDGSRSKTGVADVEIKLGYDWLCEETCYAYGYVGVVIPTGNKPKGEYVFEPIIGNNHHFGVMWGGALGFELWRGCDGDRHLMWNLETNGRYLFRNTQTRSFDLYNKQWSRYSLVYTSAADAASLAPIEGIDLFTQKMRVNPRWTFDMNSALTFDVCRWELEAGYNMWARQCEKVSLKTPWANGTVALVGFDSLSGAPVAAINRAVTIRETFAGSNIVAPALAADYANNSIQAGDINLESAAAPCALSHTIYGSAGYNFDMCGCWPIFAGLGGSYEFGSCNSVLQRWMVWGKIGVSI
ncbi:hypothetical protein HYX58_06395 [Candidatus Dependentiae bacterium]|nr:hypothetical protein [Candidatus Dependentiae bacterium]